MRARDDTQDTHTDTVPRPHSCTMAVKPAKLPATHDLDAFYRRISPRSRAFEARPELTALLQSSPLPTAAGWAEALHAGERPIVSAAARVLAASLWPYQERTVSWALSREAAGRDAIGV